MVQADPVTKGQTAAASYKPAILSNGVRVMVPPHIEAGTRVVVNIAEAATSSGPRTRRGARSANLDVMLRAARAAARLLVRDFGEVEQLQVSIKGPGDFVCRRRPHAPSR